MKAIVAYVNTIVVDGSGVQSLNSLITSIGSEDSIIYIYEAISTTANLIVPATCAIVIDANGSINQSTYTLEIRGAFSAPPEKVFMGTGRVSFWIQSVAEILPNWFGAIGDNNAANATTNVTAFTMAMNAVSTAYANTPLTTRKLGHKVKVLPGIYYVDTTITIAGEYTIVDAYGASFRYTGATGGCFKTTVSNVSIFGPFITLHVDNANVYGIHIYRCNTNWIRDVKVVENTAGMLSNVGIYIESNGGSVGITNRIENFLADCGKSIDIYCSVGIGSAVASNYFYHIVDKSYSGISIRGMSGNYFDFIMSDIDNSGAGYAATIVKVGAVGYSMGNELVFAKMDTCLGISIEAGSTNQLITKLDASSGTGGVSLAGNASNYLEILDVDYPVNTYKTSTFTANDTTPSVRGKKVAKTANALARTITMLDDGVEGQIVRVILNDNNTTIDFTGSHLKGNAGVDWVPRQFDYMDCVFDGTDWYCDVVDCTI